MEGTGETNRIIAAADKAATNVRLGALARDAQRTVNAVNAAVGEMTEAQLTDPGANEHKRLLKEYISLKNKEVTSSDVQELKQLIRELEQLRNEINTLLERDDIHPKRRANIDILRKSCMSLIGNRIAQKREVEKQLKRVKKFHAQTDFPAETVVVDAGAGVAEVADFDNPNPFADDAVMGTYFAELSQCTEDCGKQGQKGEKAKKSGCCWAVRSRGTSRRDRARRDAARANKQAQKVGGARRKKTRRKATRRKDTRRKATRRKATLKKKHYKTKVQLRKKRKSRRKPRRNYTMLKR